MRSFRVGGTSLPTFESSVNKSVQVFCLSRPDRVPPRSVSVLYSIAAGSLVSLFRPLSAFKGGRKSGGDRRRTAASVPVMQKVGPVRASLRCLVSWPVQLPWNRGSRPRCEIAAVLQPAALVSCEFQPVFSSIRAIHVPPPSSFFFYACADFFSRLSFLESDIKEATWSRTKETISILLLTFARTFFFFFLLRREIYRAINHVDIHISRSHAPLFIFSIFTRTVHRCISLVFVISMYHWEAILHFKTQMCRLIIDIIEIFNSLTYSPFQKNRNTITVNEILILTWCSCVSSLQRFQINKSEKKRKKDTGNKMSRTRFIRDTYRKREHVKRGIVCPFCGRRNLSENKRGSLTPRNARQAVQKGGTSAPASEKTSACI